MPKPLQEFKTVSIEPMLWVPGQGPNVVKLEALERMFPKPNEPLGEAWFIGDSRWMFGDLNENGVEGTSADNLGKYLDELLGGMANFSGVREWAEWYGYLAPRLLNGDNFGGTGWHQSLCNGLLMLVLCNQENHVTRYESDFAGVLLPWIMHPQFWEKTRFLPLRKKGNWQDRQGIFGVNSDISESLFMAWRYLPPRAIGPWFRSIIAIKDLVWRAHLIIWLVEIWPFFARSNTKYATLKECRFELLWSESHRVLNAANPERHPERRDWELVPTPNIAALQSAIRQEFRPHTYLEWIEQFAAQPDLWVQMELWLNQMQDRYL